MCMCYVKSLCFLWKYVYVYVLDFPCWALGSFLFVYMCRKVDNMAVRFMEAWRMCIGDGRIQGIESSVFEDVVVYYDLYMYFSALVM